MPMFRSILLTHLEHVIAHFIGRDTDPVEKGEQVLSQRIKLAEKHVVGISKYLIEAEGVITYSCATNFAHGIFCNVRNISPTVINIVRQHFDQTFESPIIGEI